MRRPTRTTKHGNLNVDEDGWADDHLTLLNELARKRIASYRQQSPAPQVQDGPPRVTPAMTPDGRHRPAMQRYWMDVAAERARQKALAKPVIPRAGRRDPRPS